MPAWLGLTRPHTNWMILNFENILIPFQNDNLKQEKEEKKRICNMKQFSNDGAFCVVCDSFHVSVIIGEWFSPGNHPFASQ